METTLPSGAKLVVTESSYQDANALLKTLAQCAKGIQLPKNFLEADVTALKDLLVKAIVSQEVEDALFRCALRAMYENVRVTRDLFDDPKLKEKARGDYFLILWNVVEVNCAPFFGQTFSILRDRLKTAPSVQPSPSMSTTPS